MVPGRDLRQSLRDGGHECGREVVIFPEHGYARKHMKCVGRPWFDIRVEQNDTQQQPQYRIALQPHGKNKAADGSLSAAYGGVRGLLSALVVPIACTIGCFQFGRTILEGSKGDTHEHTR